MKKWFVLAIGTSLTGVCLAQSAPMVKKEQPVSANRVKQEQKKAPLAKFSMGMIESDRIQPGYAGMPVAELVGAIEKLSNVKKGEFESTTDFDARKAAALTGKFLGDSTVDDNFSFVLPVSSGSQFLGGLKYNFNADTSEVRLFVLPQPSSTNGIGGPNYPNAKRGTDGLDQLDLDFKVNSTRKYQASNAFGASVIVEESSATQIGIVVNRMPFLSVTRALTYPNPAPTTQFNLENAKAAKELPAMKALVVMKVADPYILYNYDHVKPTRDRPVELSTQSKYLTGSVLGVVFYSGLTGEVFARVPENFGKPVPKIESQ